MKPQFGLLMPLLIGTDGVQKMSKSFGNYVGLSEDPLTMYSKLEKIADSSIAQYFELLTDLPLDDLPENPREKQKLLALEIVSQYRGKEVAERAQLDAMVLVQGAAGQADAVPEFSLANVQFPAKLFYILSASGLCKSSGDGRKLMQGGGVKLEGDKVSDVNLTFASPAELEGKVLQVGKNKFVRLVS
jgi:tyrosyl-tRNA synthetase